MSKHLKIFVSVLFIVIITLLICITRFYFDVSKDTAKNISNPVVYSRTEQSVFSQMKMVFQAFRTRTAILFLNLFGIQLK